MRNSRTLKDVGFVIKIKNFREADKLVIFFSKENGKVECLAKASGKPQSRKGRHLDLLNLCKFSIHKGRNLDLLIEVELLNDFQELKNDLSSVADIFYLLEIIDKFTTISQQDLDIFDLLTDLLQQLPSSTNPTQLLLAFELKFLEITGFNPELASCIFCGVPLAPDEARIAAAKGDVGYLCRKHFDQEDYQHTLVSDRILKIQKFLLAHKLSSFGALNISEQDLIHLRNINRTWLEGIIENRLQSATLLNKVKHYSKTA